MTYRRQETALNARRQAVDAEISELDLRLTAHAADRRRREDLLQERAELDAVLASRSRLPLLSNVRIASPCNAKWEEMQGDARRRFCSHCRKHVYNLSAMAAEEAEALLQETDGQICKRLYRRKDGTVLTQDCPVGVSKKRVDLALGAAAVALVAAAVASALGLDSENAKLASDAERLDCELELPESPATKVSMGL